MARGVVGLIDSRIFVETTVKSCRNFVCFGSAAIGWHFFLYLFFRKVLHIEIIVYICINKQTNNTVMTIQAINFTDKPAVAVLSMAKSLFKALKKYDTTAVLCASKSTQSYYVEDCFQYNGVFVSYAIRVSDHAKPGEKVENYIKVDADDLEIEIYDAEGAKLARKAIEQFFNSINA